MASQIEMWDGEQWRQLWMTRVVGADPSFTRLLCFQTAEESESSSAAPIVVAERPFIVQGASEEDFRIEAGRNVYQCRCTDAGLRKQLLAECSTPTDWEQMRADFPREIGPEGRYWFCQNDHAGRLGQGGYANVLRGIDTHTGEAVAIKESKNSFDQVHDKSEIVLQASLKHPNIVAVRDFVYVPEGEGEGGPPGQGGKIYTVMEVAAGGEFFSAVARAKGMEELDVRHFFRQILWGVAYCHGRLVCHRDLKLENLLLDSTYTKVQITDFGFAKNIGGGGTSCNLCGELRL